jgi:PAS domain S-box-containing protein
MAALRRELGELKEQYQQLLARSRAEQLQREAAREVESRGYVAQPAVPAKVLFEATHDAVWLVRVEPNDRFVAVAGNAAFEALARQSATQLIGRPIEECVPAEDVPAVLARHRAAVESRVPIRYEETGVFRQARTIGITLTPVFDARGTCTYLLGAAIDLTALRETEKMLLATEVLSQLTIDSLEVQLVVVDAHGVIVQANAAWRRFVRDQGTASLADTAVGRSYAEAAALSGLFPAAGLEPPVDEALRSVLEGRLPLYNCEYAVDLPAGKRWFHLNIVPFAGVQQGAVVSRTDITARKSAEAAMTSIADQLRESQKLGALGMLAAGIAHEFSNLLTVIDGYVSAAARDAGRNVKVTKSLDLSRRACKSAHKVAKQIMAFGRKEPAERRVLSLGQVVEEALELLRVTLPPGAELRVHAAADAPLVQVDPTQIQQVVMNLVINAAHALERRSGAITVGVDAASPAGDGPTRGASLGAGRFARLTVTDTGKGMDPETLARVFEARFTTRPAGRGAGLGLAVAQSIVHAHAGVITATSSPGRGSTFSVYLPAATSAAPIERPEHRPTKEPASATRAGGQRILYVDDQAWLLPLAERLLTDQGYRVQTYADPKVALEAFADDPGAFDLVVADYKMPGVTGLNFARRVKAVRPALPVVLASALLPEEIRESATAAGIDAVLYKPALATELVPLVSKLLAAPPTAPAGD